LKTSRSFSRTLFNSLFALICLGLAVCSAGSTRIRHDKKDDGTPLPARFSTGIDPLTIGRESSPGSGSKAKRETGEYSIPGAGESEISSSGGCPRIGRGSMPKNDRLHRAATPTSRRAKEALRQGKKITAARLRIAHDKTEWEFTFKADHFHFPVDELPTLPKTRDESRPRRAATRKDLPHRKGGGDDGSAVSDFPGATAFEVTGNRNFPAMQTWISESN